MLPFSFADGLFFYAALWLILIIFLWLRELHRNRRSGWELVKGRLFSCSSCHHLFIVKDSRNVVRCPKCNAMCILRKHRN